MCPCLKALDDLLLKRGITTSFRGAAWSLKSREWAYYPVVLDRPQIRAALSLPSHVIDHVHRGTHDGAEADFVCSLHDDAVMGEHPDVSGKLAVLFHT